MTGIVVWVISMVVLVIVGTVVAVLLKRVHQTAIGILGGASQIWTNGKLVARDTVQLAIFLRTTNEVVEQILETAKQIVGATDAIEQHAEGCPGCPECVLGGK